MSAHAVVKVWDPLVRVFHWSLVVAFFIAYFTEGDLITLHAYAGYAVLGLILFRILWGFVGTRHARFTDFVTTPATALRYVKDTLALRAKRYLGHNPAGGAMIVVLIISLLLTTLTGLAAYGAIETAGPLAGWFGDSGEAWEDILRETHEVFANLTVALVAIHILGVIVESLIHKENLARAMVTGYKPAARHDDLA